MKNLNKEDYKLCIVGDGYNRTKLKRLITSKKLNKKIQLKGYLNNINQQYRKAKLFVMPSLYEGLGNVLIDAINFSVPCIVTNCKSGPSEIVCRGKGGTIVPINDIDALSKAMNDDIKNYNGAIKKLNFAKKKLIRFNSESQGLKYLATLEKVLK